MHWLRRRQGQADRGRSITTRPGSGQAATPAERGKALTLRGRNELARGDASAALRSTEEAVRVLQPLVRRQPPLLSTLGLALDCASSAHAALGNMPEAKALQARKAAYLTRTTNRADLVNAPAPAPSDRAGVREAYALMQDAHRGTLHGLTGADAYADAIAAFRDLAEDHADVSFDPEVIRGLAQALWRGSMSRTAHGDPGRAIADLREAIALSERLLDLTPPDDPWYDAVVAQLSMAMSDLGQMALTTRRHEEHRRMLESSIRVAELSAGQCSRRALGVALYNSAAHRTNLFVHHMMTGRTNETEAEALFETARRAVLVRETRVDPTEPVTSYELANANLLFSHVLYLIGDRREAQVMLSTAHHNVCGAEGLAVADELRAQIEEELQGFAQNGDSGDRT